MTDGRDRRDFAVARNLTGLVLGVLVLGMAMNATGMIAADRPESMRVLQLIATLPMLCYLAAVWSIFRAFSALTNGDDVERVVARLLVRMGACLFTGGLLRVFAEPLLTRLVMERPWPYANFDVAAITLGTVGLLLMLLARQLSRAAEMRAELGGFV